MNELAATLGFAQQTAPEPLALASVVHVAGSVYRRPGARMLIAASGKSAGMISGGCLEGDVKERAMSVLQSGHSTLITYDSVSNDDIVFGLGLGCNGVVQVMIEPLQREDENGLLSFLHACHATRATGRIATVFSIRPGKEDACDACPAAGCACDKIISSFKTVERTLHWPDGRKTSTVLRPALRSKLDTAIAELGSRRIKTGLAMLPGGDEANWLVESIVPPPSLFIFGAGDDAIPVASIAHQLGWRVNVTDARPAYATHQRFPQADQVRCQRAELDEIGDIAGSLVLIMTHSYEQDKSWLRALLPSAAAYISQIGPKARTARLLGELRAEGQLITDEQFARLIHPAGLDIGAETPAEVALSIVAGMQAALTRRSGIFLGQRDGPIHEPVG